MSNAKLPVDFRPRQFVGRDERSVAYTRAVEALQALGDVDLATRAAAVRIRRPAAAPTVAMNPPRCAAAGGGQGPAAGTSAYPRRVAHARGGDFGAARWPYLRQFAPT